MNQGKDSECAKRCSDIAPLIPKELKLSFSGVLRLYRDAPTQGVFINKRLKELAATSDLFQDVVAFMSHFTPSESYPDFSLAPIREALTTPVEQGGAGFTQAQVQRILDAGVQKQEISLSEIEFVRVKLWS
jgi:hypothetical protein